MGLRSYLPRFRGNSARLAAVRNDRLVASGSHRHHLTQALEIAGPKRSTQLLAIYSIFFLFFPVNVGEIANR